MINSYNSSIKLILIKIISSVDDFLTHLECRKGFISPVLRVHGNSRQTKLMWCGKIKTKAKKYGIFSWEKNAKQNIHIGNWKLIDWSQNKLNDFWSFN